MKVDKVKSEKQSRSHSKAPQSRASDDVTHKVLDIVADKPEVSLEEVAHRLGQTKGAWVDRTEALRALRSLEDSGLGKIYLGRRGKQTRFVAAPPEAPKPVQQRMVTITIPDGHVSLRDLISAFKAAKTDSA